MLAATVGGTSFLQENVGTTSAELGTTVTGSGSAHTKGSYAELVASTAYDSYGISILCTGLNTAASTNNRALVDIAVGAAASEVTLIDNLLAGNQPNLGGATKPSMYHFPIFIAAGTRLAARMQGSTTSETCTVAVWLHQHPIGVGGWFGTRVTTYGANTGTSSGTDHTAGNSSYATATQITASSTNPIRALQLGIDMASDTTGNNRLGLVRVGVGATPTYIASDLPYGESTTVETLDFTLANFVLSHMRFNLPAAQSLHVSAMMNGAGEARGFCLYGVD